MSRSDVEKDIRDTLGQIPSFFETMPDSTLENEWREFKVFQLSDTGQRPRETPHRLRGRGRHPLPGFATYFHRGRDDDDGHDGT